MAYIGFASPLSYSTTISGNPNDPKPNKDSIVVPEYDEKDKQYLTFLQRRIESAKEQRDRTFAEFSNLSYMQQFERNEKSAHTFIEPKQNQDDPILSMGTIEAKLNTLLSHVSNLNLIPEILAFDRENTKLQDLSDAFTDILDVTAEHDGGDDGGDEEKRMLRQKELLKQGTVFVQENWMNRYEIKKVLKDNYNGEFKGFTGYSEKLKKVFEGPSRDVLYAPNVYLGDITQFSMNDQPFAFTVEQMHYDTAKTIYGGFDNWKFVRPGIPATSSSQNGANVGIGARTIYEGKWRLTQLAADQVEIIKYQDPTRDEFSILVNGMPMLPTGFPLSAVVAGGRYNIAKQVLYVINPQFAYGKSFVASGSVQEVSKILDEMIRLFVLKTRKSLTPAYINTTNKVISRRALAPGNISMGIAPNALTPIGVEGQGVTANEYQIFKELQDQIDKSTVSASFQGQQGKSGTTATEIIELQRQAKLTLGIIVTACTLLEQKLGYLRLWNVMNKWLDPIGIYADGTNRYRSATRTTNIDGAGQGQRRVIPIDGSLPSPDAIRMLSLEDEKIYGYPVRRTYLSPMQLREAELTFRCVVIPKEKESSAYNKLLFREELADLATLVQFGAQPNIQGLVDEYGHVYSKDRGKFFKSGTAAAAQAVAQNPTGAPTDPKAAGGQALAGGVPTAPPVAG